MALKDVFPGSALHNREHSNAMDAVFSSQSIVASVADGIAMANLCDLNLIKLSSTLRATVRHALRMRARAMSFTGSHPTLARGIGKVIDHCANKQMVRPNTRGIVAMMANVKAIWNRVVEHLPRYSVGTLGDHLAPAIVNSYLPVTMVGFRTHPYPAWAEFGAVLRDWAILVHFGPEAVRKRTERDTRIVAGGKPSGLAFDPTVVPVVLRRDSGLLPATALTEADGDDRMILHDDLLSHCAVPSAAITVRGLMLAESIAQPLGGCN